MSNNINKASSTPPFRGGRGAVTNNAAEKAILKAIVIQPSRVDTAEIETWKSAVNNAKRGNRSALYNLYENLLSDPVLSEAMESRVEAITNAEITFQVNGDNVEEIDDLIDTPEFEEMIKEIALQKAWGKSVIDTRFEPTFDVFSFPRKNIRIRNMEKPRSEWKKYIAAKESDMDGYDYTQDEFMIECGGDDDLGYLWRAAQYVIYKRGGFGDWAQFAEIFGMPFVTGRYNSYDTTTRDQLYEALEKIGGKPYAAIPNEANIEIHDNKSSGSNELYGSLRRACNEEILIAVKGNTMTTLDGSSRAQAEVHENVQSGKIKSDRRYVQRVLNKFFVPLLIKRGYPVAGGFFLFPEQGEKMKVADQVDLGLKLRNAGIPVADNYFYEITGIPAAEIDDNATQSPKGEEKTENASPDKDDKTDDPKTPPSPGEEGAGMRPKPKKQNLFDRFFAYAPQLPFQGVGGQGDRRSFATKLTDSITGKLTLNDKYTIDLNKLLQEALNEVYSNAEKEKKQPIVSEPLFKISNDALQHGINSVFSEPEFGKKNEAFINEFRHNTAVFAAFKNHRQTEEIVALLYDEDGNLRSFREFKKLALQVSKDYNVNWLQTEYNTAVRAARSAVNYRKALETKDIYPNLEYIESTASKQRETHLEYVGTILPIEHPWWDTHMPPSDWNCACSTRPTNKDVTPVPPEDLVSPTFKNNPGKTAEPVNLKEHPYIKGVCPYFDKCKRRNYGSQLRLDLSDEENPPIIPQCHACKLAHAYSDNLKRIKENRDKYDSLGDEWEKVFFNEKNGGYLAIHKGRIENSGKSNNERKKFNKEKLMCMNFANAGHTIEMLNEIPRVPSSDVLFDAIFGELKKLSSHNNIVKEAKDAIYKKNAEVLLFEFTEETEAIYLELDKLQARFGIKAYYYFTSIGRILKNF